MGCASDEGSPVGAQLLTERAFGNVVPLDPIPAARDSSFRVQMSLGKGSNLVGRAGGLTAKTLLLFPASSFPDVLRDLEAQLEEVKLQLISDHVYGAEAEGAEFQIAMYEVLDEWSEEEVLSDAQLAYEQQPQCIVPIGASASDTITCALPLSLVEGWMDSTSEGNFGILIAPAVSEVPSFVKRFGSSEYGSAPLLRIGYIKGEVVDSTTVRPSEDAVLVDREFPLVTAGNLILAEGDVHRSLLWFELPEVDSLVTVNSAVLSLEVDPVRSFAERMIVQAWPAAVASWEKEALRTEFSGDPPRAVVNDTTMSVSIDVRLMVQDWFRDPSTNTGILLRSAGEQENIFTVFFNNPRLRITYSEPPGTETLP
jgi:hypothetical protein